MMTWHRILVTIATLMVSVMLCTSFLMRIRDTHNAHSNVPTLTRGTVRLLSTDGKGPVVGSYVGAPWRQENQWWAWRTQTGGMQATPALVVFEEAPASSGKP